MFELYARIVSSDLGTSVCTVTSKLTLPTKKIDYITLLNKTIKKKTLCTSEDAETIARSIEDEINAIIENIKASYFVPF